MNPGFVTQFSLLQLLVAKALHDWLLLKGAACVALVGHLPLTSRQFPVYALCSQHGHSMCSFLPVLSAGAS